MQYFQGSRLVSTVGSLGKSPIFWTSLGVSVYLLCYVRRQIQGYWYDRTAQIDARIKSTIADKTIVITGGNSGIGFGAAQICARLGAHVIIASRNEEKSAKAVDTIKKKYKTEKAEYRKLDLSDIQSIHRFSEQLRNDNIDIDVLICNAGIAGVQKQLTKDNFNRLFQINYLGHWLLVNDLLPILKKTADQKYANNGDNDDDDNADCVRIISVSSGAHTRSRLNCDKFDEIAMKTIDGCGYGDSKLLQILHTKELQKRLDSQNYSNKIKCVDITPGFVRTPIIDRNMPPWLAMILPIIYPLYWFAGRDLISGAQVIAHAAFNAAIKPGGYYSNCCEKQPEIHITTEAGDQKPMSVEEACAVVWERTEALVKRYDVSNSGDQ